MQTKISVDPAEVLWGTQGGAAQWGGTRDGARVHTHSRPVVLGLPNAATIKSFSSLLLNCDFATGKNHNVKIRVFQWS